MVQRVSISQNSGSKPKWPKDGATQDSPARAKVGKDRSEAQKSGAEAVVHKSAAAPCNDGHDGADSRSGG